MFNYIYMYKLTLLILYVKIMLIQHFDLPYLTSKMYMESSVVRLEVFSKEEKVSLC